MHTNNLTSAQHIFPLVLALLRYSAQLLRQGEIRLLDQSEFSNIIISLRTILFAVKDRIDSLIGIFKLRNIPIQDELRKYCHGMYFDEMDRENSYYNMPETDVDAPDADENMGFDNLEIVIASRCQRLCTDDYDVLDVSGYEVTMPSSSRSVASVFRPSDEQPITNRPHALWKVGIAATLSRVTAGHISWWILKRRRDQRLRFIELLHQRGWEGFRKASQWKEFQTLRQGLLSADLRFYRSLARNPVSHQTTKMGNSAARIQVSASLTVEDKTENRVQNSVSHQATGTVYTSVVTTSVLPLRLESREKPGEGSPLDLLPSNPEGHSNPFEENEKADMAPQRNNSDLAHHWSHDMVLCTNSDVPVMKKTLDERLASLEQKLGTQEFLLDISTQTFQSRLEAVESQLQEVEKLLRILVEGKP
ncbi:hypothetical protein M422DRAFT_781489 [Sphaerobolus stellatus SS14]|uniref:Uncharacterized protein n=1 Tax=Sphaerobolus stellatus (strain SS14) TaxID=990650 RepID=A0A0C9V9G5_SPHS4|nr:hypothetical protein M422DRAFT_781489 [Sphaerobolus stellatus SS14]